MKYVLKYSIKNASPRKIIVGAANLMLGASSIVIGYKVAQLGFNTFMSGVGFHASVEG